MVVVVVVVSGCDDGGIATIAVAAKIASWLLNCRVCAVVTAFLLRPGRFDECQLRFKQGHKLSDNFYVKQDGTRVFYFTLDDLRALMCGEGTGERTGEGTGEGTGGAATGSSASSSPSSSPSQPSPFGAGCGAGLEVVELSYVRRQYANRGTQTARFRVWVHGAFRRPIDTPLGVPL